MIFEVELKIQLTDSEKNSLESFLNSDNFKGSFEGEFEQTDYYFDTEIPSFAREDTALRVRVERSLSSKEKSIELTYKGKKINTNSKTRLEYNINLTPDNDFKSIEGFFNGLGFRNSIAIVKKRRNYLLEPGVVLSYDSNEIGDFVEIEKIVEDKDLLVPTEDYLWNKLHSIIGKIPKERKIIKSYLELILESKGLIL